MLQLRPSEKLLQWQPRVALLQQWDTQTLIVPAGQDEGQSQDLHSQAQG